MHSLRCAEEFDMRNSHILLNYRTILMYKFEVKFTAVLVLTLATVQCDVCIIVLVMYI